ncbi:C40 family peptidase [Sulfurimonas marina]|uniref:NlpC/P60 domain-containing protein n=1 Tax=Sulfurimonas marina TaxID=2590551 RepID=A0A7M3V9Q7_9BACT|nr:NlpC/P60 family protein [Sulfurimonas marina]QOP40490.1 hypothetical protein FJR03_01535 [Sulfurimonas marina]
MPFLLFVVTSLLLLSGCSGKSPQTKEYATLTPYSPSPKQELSYKLRNKNPVTLTIYEQYKKWVNTPYKYGGTTCYGIDCSSLVQQVYKDGFGLNIPRDTKHQAKVGTFVKKPAIKEGDLLLFKTGYSSRHSGVYLEAGNFLHTSTKHGVTISNLNNPYWREKYWQARRILNY